MTSGADKTELMKPWDHDHVFGQTARRDGETRTRIVLILTVVTMFVEVGAGLAFGSMALLADGLHMGGHAAVLGISVFAYFVARRFARDERFSFGTGKVNALGGYTGALLLGGFAFFMVWESTERLFSPQPITFDQALVVAALGLIVNGVSAYILHPPGKAHGHDHGFAHGHAHSHAHGHDHHGLHHHGGGHAHGEDHNLRAAYLHVLADALTSVLAIVALLAGKYFGATWLDSAIGIIGAVIVGFWALSLIRASSAVLLDMQAPQAVRDKALAAIEESGDAKVEDLHIWSVGPGIYAAEIALRAADPHAPEIYKSRLPAALRIVHVAIETHRCPDTPQALARAAE